MSNENHQHDAKSCNDLSMAGGSNRSPNSRVRAQKHCDNCDNRDNLCLCDDGAAENPNIAKARAIWDRSVPIQGTLAEVYLQARGVAGSSLECLAFAMLHEDGQLRPTLIARVQDACGNTCGISRTPADVLLAGFFASGCSTHRVSRDKASLVAMRSDLMLARSLPNTQRKGRETNDGKQDLILLCGMIGQAASSYQPGHRPAIEQSRCVINSDVSNVG